ncbi:hypothetical protein PMAG_a0908 [Pseudoalteromonas mariniglutinosa NCIMB 1770]|nr:hypothetical protein [Pseudoalteromonas mariniglutinosa NCIMB 1770]
MGTELVNLYINKVHSGNSAKVFVSNLLSCREDIMLHKKVYSSNMR